MIPLTARALAEAAANVYDGMLGEGLADLRRMPATVIDEGPQRTVHRYHPAEAAPRRRRAARCRCCSCRRWPRPRCASTCGAAARSPSTSCWRAARPTSSTTGRSSSPTARSASSTGSRTSCRARSAPPRRTPAAGPVQVVGWCLGGILSLLALAADRELPVASAALIASPFDFSKVPLVAPLRPIAAVTGGAGITTLYRLLGGAPAPLVKRGYQLAGIDKYLMKPWTVLSNLHDRELLSQIEAVDAFMDRMHAYPGRTFGQLYHRFFRTNDLADGRFAVTGGRSTSPTCACRSCPSPAAATASRRSRPAITSSRCSRTRASSSPPRRAATSACSPAARRPGRRGGSSTRSSTRQVLQSAVHGGQSRGAAAA